MNTRALPDGPRSDLGGVWPWHLVVPPTAPSPLCRVDGSSVLSRQQLHVQPDEERGQRRPLRHGAVGGPHCRHALLPEAAALLPWLGVPAARPDELRHQALDGNSPRSRAELAWGVFTVYRGTLGVHKARAVHPVQLVGVGDTSNTVRRKLEARVGQPPFCSLLPSDCLGFHRSVSPGRDVSVPRCLARPP